MISACSAMQVFWQMQVTMYALWVEDYQALLHYQENLFNNLDCIAFLTRGNYFTLNIILGFFGFYCFVRHPFFLLLI
jgi:hypothetical protein